MEEFTLADFVMDSLPGAIYAGYTNGDDWNGWACPYFERQQAEAVLRASEQNGFQWRYDAGSDTYIVSSQRADNEPEVFEGMEIEAKGNSLKVYPIGAYSWIWELVEVE